MKVITSPAAYSYSKALNAASFLAPSEPFSMLSEYACEQEQAERVRTMVVKEEIGFEGVYDQLFFSELNAARVIENIDEQWKEALDKLLLEKPEILSRIFDLF